MNSSDRYICRKICQELLPGLVIKDLRLCQGRLPRLQPLCLPARRWQNLGIQARECFCRHQHCNLKIEISKFLSRSAHRRLGHQEVRRSVAHGHELPCFPAASAVELEIVAHRSHMHQRLENLAGQGHIA